MLKPNKIYSLSILGLALIFPINGQAQNFYKWVDANGSTHYTTTPPPKNAKKLGSVPTMNDTPSGSSYTPPPPQNEADQPTQQGNHQSNNIPKNGERIPLPAPIADPTQKQPPIGQDTPVVQ